MSTVAAVKTSVPVPLKPKARPSEDALEDSAKSEPQKRPVDFSPRHFWAALSAALLVSAGITASVLAAHRYELVPAARTENAVMYRLDRLTGRVSLCWPAACVAVGERKEGENVGAAAH